MYLIIYLSNPLFISLSGYRRLCFEIMLQIFGLGTERNTITYTYISVGQSVYYQNHRKKGTQKEKFKHFVKVKC